MGCFFATQSTKEQLKNKNDTDADVNRIKNSSLLESYRAEVPNHFLCPITIQIMEDPVINSVGQTYQRKNIEQWFAKGKRIDPTTGQELQSTVLIPNYALKNSIKQYLDLALDIEKKMKQQRQKRQKMKKEFNERKIGNEQYKLNNALIQAQDKYKVQQMEQIKQLKEKFQKIFTSTENMKIIYNRQRQENLKLKNQLDLTKRKYQIQSQQNLLHLNQIIQLKDKNQENSKLLKDLKHIKQELKKDKYKKNLQRQQLKYLQIRRDNFQRLKNRCLQVQQENKKRIRRIEQIIKNNKLRRR